MIFRGRVPEETVWRRFRSPVDPFTFARRDDALFEAHVAANAERIVELFYTLIDHLSPAVDVALEDKRSHRAWRGAHAAMPDVRDAIARMKVSLATYGGVEFSIYSSDDQLTLTPQLELYIYARSDRWLYLLQGMGLEESPTVPDKRWRRHPWDRTPAPVLTEAVVAAALRLSLEPA